MTTCHKSLLEPSIGSVDINILNLTKAHLIGEGRDRLCYQHPDIYDSCVKVAKTSEKQTRRERCYFKYLYFQKKDCRYLAEYQSDCQTDRGPGAMFRLIRDFNGSISKTLTQCMLDDEIKEDELAILSKNLKKYLFENAICVRDLSPNNVVVQKNEKSNELIIIDGVSNASIVPFAVFFTFWVRIHLEKSWNSYELKVKKIRKNKRNAKNN